MEGLTENEYLRLLREHAGWLHRVAWAVLGEEAAAWDALQEAAIAGLQARRSLRGGSQAYPAWMKRIVVNKCRDMLRKRRRVIPMDPHTLPEPESPSLLENAVDGMVVWETIQRLPEEQQQVVQLYYLAELTTDEISETLKVPVGTVKSRLYRAREHIRCELGNEHQGRDSG